MIYMFLKVDYNLGLFPLCIAGRTIDSLDEERDHCSYILQNKSFI